MEEPRHFKAQCARYSYAVLYDPLDGSSNTDVNGALGTIFALRRRKPGHGDGIEDVLAAGSEQIAAGYGLTGSVKDRPKAKRDRLVGRPRLFRGFARALTSYWRLRNSS